MNFRDRDLPREELFTHRLVLGDDILLFRIGVETFYSVMLKYENSGDSYKTRYDTIDAARDSWNWFKVCGWKPESK